MRFFLTLSVVRIAKNGSFLKGERGWRGERRGPWGTKPQGPENLMLFDFSQKLFSADRMIVYGDHIVNF